MFERDLKNPLLIVLFIELNATQTSSLKFIFDGKMADDIDENVRKSKVLKKKKLSGKKKESSENGFIMDQSTLSLIHNHSFNWITLRTIENQQHFKQLFIL